MLRNATSLIAAAGLALAFLWLAGPALSTERYRPDAVDFSQPLPALERVGQPQARSSGADDHEQEHAHEHGHGDGHEPVRFLGPVVTAPSRFDLVGIGGYTGEVELRVRELDGEWSEWVAIAHGDPLYTGGSEQVQVRSRHGKPAGKLHYVNVSGDATTAGGILNAARGAINSAVIATIGGSAAAEAVAASPEPNFVTRRAWGAKGKGGCEPRNRPSMGKVKGAAVHHTVSSNTYTEAEAPGIVLGICRYHRNGNGWADIGYNALVDRFGNTYQGRAGGMSRPVVGAHTEGFNSKATGVAVIGNHSSAKLPRKAFGALKKYLAWKLGVHGVPALGNTTITFSKKNKVKLKRIFGHRDANSTSCPGEAAYGKLPKLRRKVQQRMDEYGGPEPPGDDGGGGGTGTGGGGLPRSDKEKVVVRHPASRIRMSSKTSPGGRLVVKGKLRYGKPRCNRKHKVLLKRAGSGGNEKVAKTRSGRDGSWKLTLGKRAARSGEYLVQVRTRRYETKSKRFVCKGFQADRFTAG